MKKIVFRLVLVVMMVFGVMLMVGCPTDTKETEETKRVAEQYRFHRYYTKEKDYFVEIGDNGSYDYLRIFKRRDGSQAWYPAWTVGTELWHTFEGRDGKIGEFQQDGDIFKITRYGGPTEFDYEIDIGTIFYVDKDP